MPRTPENIVNHKLGFTINQCSSTPPQVRKKKGNNENVIHNADHIAGNKVMNFGRSCSPMVMHESYANDRASLCADDAFDDQVRVKNPVTCWCAVHHH